MRSEPDYYIDIVRFYFGLVNFGFLVSGGCILYCALCLKLYFEQFLKISLGYSYEAPYVMAFIGAVIIVSAFLGCICLIIRNYSLLQWYGVFLFSLLFFEITLSFYMTSYNNYMLTEGFIGGIEKSIRDYDWNPKENHTIDLIQNEMNCCGSESFNDWTLNPRKAYPQSCSGLKGCTQKLQTFVAYTVPLLGTVIWIAESLTLLGAILAWIVGNSNDYSSINKLDCNCSDK